MILPFKDEVINDYDLTPKNFMEPNFIGFLNKYGEPIYFKDKFGYHSHGDSLTFQEVYRLYYPLQFNKTKYLSEFEKYITSNNI